MTISFETPGVHILEQTGPGVIAGVGTSTAAFLGPALAGPMFEPRRITSFDDFLRLYAVLDPNGNPQPFITSPRRFCLPQAVQGFFENGGRQAFIVRVGTAEAALWEVKNQDGQPMFRLRAREAGPVTFKIAVELVHATGTPGASMVIASTAVDAVGTGNLSATVANPERFAPGDTVTQDGNAEAKITRIENKVLHFGGPLVGLNTTNPLRIADLKKGRATIRMQDASKLVQGSLVKISGGGQNDFAVVQSVNDSFVTFSSTPPRTKDFSTATAAPTLESQDIRLTIGGKVFDNLWVDPAHPNNVFHKVVSDLAEVLPPRVTVTSPFDKRMVQGSADLPPSSPGKPDDLSTLGAAEFEKGLKALAGVDDVNIVCAPDAAILDPTVCIPIQQAIRLHCGTLKDRFAVLDPISTDTAGEIIDILAQITEQRKKIETEDGRLALYFPWLEVRDPLDRSVPPRTMFIPPSGHLAGIYARTDQERGVHKAPANTDVRGALGLQYRLSDPQQGPLNTDGINVLRIFPGSASVIVWGARTTVRKDVSDWLYVNVRRLLLFIEESIEEGIRFAVFEPNAPPLWKALTRTISQFLTQVWRDGALFGATPDQAFRVRIDEALNPPEVRARGRLFIEIRVAPVRPAEFIIVKIGLFDGGAEVEET